MKINNIISGTINKFSVPESAVKFDSSFYSLLGKQEMASTPIGIAGSMFEDVKKSLSRTENASFDALTSEQGNLVELVTMLSETETKLKILINIRDSIISSLQEVMRMQI